MQELLPVGTDQLDLDQLMAGVGTIVSEFLTVNGALESKTEEAVLILGQVSSVDTPNATLIIGKTGVVTGTVNVKRLVHFGRIDPSVSGQTRTTVRAPEIITAKDSVIISCDVFYDRLQTHSGAKMPKVTLDETNAGSP